MPFTLHLNPTKAGMNHCSIPGAEIELASKISRTYALTEFIKYDMCIFNAYFVQASFEKLP